MFGVSSARALRQLLIGQISSRFGSLILCGSLLRDASGLHCRVISSSQGCHGKLKVTDNRQKLWLISMGTQAIPVNPEPPVRGREAKAGGRHVLEKAALVLGLLSFGSFSGCQCQKKAKDHQASAVVTDDTPTVSILYQSQQAIRLTPEQVSRQRYPWPVFKMNRCPQPNPAISSALRKGSCSFVF